MIEVKIKESDREFPIRITLNSGCYKFTIKAAEELYQKLGEKIKEHNATR